MTDIMASARRAIPFLDVQLLNNGCSCADVSATTRRVQTRHGPVASLTVLPEFVQQASRETRKTSIKIGSVVNFPTGDHTAAEVIDQTRSLREAGVDEIDVVVPWRALIEGHPENISARVARVKAAGDGATIKATLETGLLGTTDLIREAAKGARDGGADFVKTSTGRAPKSATPDSVATLMKIMGDWGADVGVIPAGDMRNPADVYEYLDLADKQMGMDWTKPDRFRIAIFDLLDKIISDADGHGDNPLKTEK